MSNYLSRNKHLYYVLSNYHLQPYLLRNTEILWYHPLLQYCYLQILASHKLEASKLHVELTESALVENETTAFDNLQAFKHHGFSIDLDDFGTGYASLSTFGTYPVDTIKIDRSFVTHIDTSRSSTAIASMIISLAKTLNMKVLAEGVETKEELNCLKSLGCYDFQGFYFSKPMPFDEFAALLAVTNDKSNKADCQPETMSFKLVG